MAAVNCVIKDKNVSRCQLQKWFIPRLNRSMTLQELSTGVAYCQLLGQLFPAAVDLKKLKLQTSSEMDRLNNWKILQQGLRKLAVDKKLELAERIKTNSAGNLDFCRWFVSFYEVNDKNLPIQLEERAEPRNNPPRILRRVGFREEAIFLHAIPNGDRAIQVTPRNTIRTRVVVQEELEEELVIAKEERSDKTFVVRGWEENTSEVVQKEMAKTQANTPTIKTSWPDTLAFFADNYFMIPAAPYSLDEEMVTTATSPGETDTDFLTQVPEDEWKPATKYFTEPSDV